MNVEERLDLLEAKVRQGSVGARGPVGPAGDIAVAVRNATAVSNKILADAEARIQAVAGTSHKQFQSEVKALVAQVELDRGELRDFRGFLNENIQTAVDNGVVRVLEDYGVKDRNGDPIRY